MSGQPAAWHASSILPPLGALRTAPATARGHVRGTLAMWRLGELSDTVELVVSELAANAVNASAGPDGRPARLGGRIPVIWVRLFAGETVLVAEVWDEAGGVPARKSAGDTDESGRGLDLVHELTNARWGWCHAPSGPGKCVWAEFPIPGIPATSDATLTQSGGDMERALITGAAGFIGSHLAAELLRRGWSVTGLDARSPASDPVAAENLGELTGDPRFQFVAGDVTGGDLAMVCEGVRAVFHLAGLPGVRRSWGDRFGDYLACNVLGTQRLLEACATTDVPRLVFASSSSVYGPGTGKPSQEGDLPLPLSPYGVSKLAAERLCLAYASQRGAATSVVALRYFTVYGPRQRPDMAFSRIMRAALSGRAMSLYGTGAQRRDFTYVSDAVTATIAAATAEARAEVVNVASGHSVSLSEARKAIARLAGTEVPAQRRVAQPGDVDATAADLARAGDLLGYQPAVELEEGLRRQWKWLAAREDPAALAMAEAAR